ncbi:MAG: peptidoglycan DD-metalloendopeptidase family protein [Spirochaetaceae bacterium]|jgi:hypothetical protein|nr:peptidoglycan DD-metalloendopeptidase family protein [Spirochaetaceae bacterium]
MVRLGGRLLPALFFVCGVSAFTFEWPSDGAVTVSNFGKSDVGRPALGDTFRSDGPLGAIEGGEIIYSRGVSSPASRFMSPLGNMLVVDHGDGLLSIYSRAAHLQTKPKSAVDAGTVIAVSGISGWSKTEGFYLSVFDRKERRWVNPSLIISSIQDTRTPSIRSVKLKDNANRITDLSVVRTIQQGAYTVIVHAEVPRAKTTEAPLMPLRIICSVNGVEAGYLAFETFSARDGVLMMFRNGLVPTSQIYASDPAVEACEVFFNRGQVTLEVIVQNNMVLAASDTEAAALPSRSAVYRLSVE